MALEEFVQIGTVPAGELVIKLPGTEIKTVYSGGESYVSKSGRMGYVALKPIDVIAVEVGEATGMVGLLGEQMRGMINDPTVKAEIMEQLAASNRYLFVSKGKEKDIVTMPGLSDNGGEVGDVIGVAYSGTPSFEEVYALHTRALRGQPVLNDRAAIEMAVLRLPERANELYNTIFDMINGF